MLIYEKKQKIDKLKVEVSHIKRKPCQASVQCHFGNGLLIKMNDYIAGQTRQHRHGLLLL